MKRFFRDVMYPFTIALCLGVFLLGCSSTGTVNTSQAVADANVVVSGVAADYKAFVTLYPATITPARQAEVLAALTMAQAALAQLQAAAIPAATGLQAVETNINTVLGVLSGACLPPICPAAVSAGLMAANVLLPLIEATINQLQGVPVTPKVAAAMAHPAMNPEQARLVLAGAAR